MSVVESSSTGVVNQKSKNVNTELKSVNTESNNVNIESNNVNISNLVPEESLTDQSEWGNKDSKEKNYILSEATAYATDISEAEGKDKVRVRNAGALLGYESKLFELLHHFPIFP